MPTFVKDSMWQTLPTLGVTPGDYTSADGSLTITVDQKGRVQNIVSGPQTNGSTMLQDANVSSYQPKDGDVLYYDLASNTWYPFSSSLGVSSAWMPRKNITVSGDTIVSGINYINTGGTSTHEIDANIPANSIIKIVNAQPYDAIITVPAGLNFSDGSLDITLGFRANYTLCYYGDNIVEIESSHPGVTS